MRTKILVVAAVVGAVALGGVALASNGSDPTVPTAATGGMPSDDTTPGEDGKSAPASPPGKGTGISGERAIRIALDHIGGGTVDEVEREFEHGRWVWSVRVVESGQRTDVDVDARTGEVVRVRTDDDRDDDRDELRDDDRDGADDRDDRDDDGRGRGSDDGPGDDDGDRDD